MKFQKMKTVLCGNNAWVPQRTVGGNPDSHTVPRPDGNQRLVVSLPSTLTVWSDLAGSAYCPTASPGRSSIIELRAGGCIHGQAGRSWSGAALPWFCGLGKRAYADSIRPNEAILRVAPITRCTTVFIARSYVLFSHDLVRLAGPAVGDAL